MRILVTGATGYLGACVVRELLDEGHRPIPCGSRDPDEWYDAIDDDGPFDRVVHLAWYAAPGDGHSDLQERCVVRSLELFDRLARMPNPPHVTFASTLSVYGGNGDRIYTEADDPAPQCAYTRAKVAAETALACSPGLRSVRLRLGSLMGLGVSRTRTDLVVNAFAQEAYRWGAFEVWNPQAWKPVIHVQDAAATVSLASAEGWTGTINVASRCLRERDIAELVRLQTGAGWTSPPGKSSGPTRSTRVSCAKLETMLAGHPRWREVPEAVAEFAGRTPTPEDRIHPWN